MRISDDDVHDDELPMMAIGILVQLRLWASSVPWPHPLSTGHCFSSLFFPFDWEVDREFLETKL
ncbi:hypothetical protein ACE6H2_000368 [Prunus campanulata]